MVAKARSRSVAMTVALVGVVALAGCMRIYTVAGTGVTGSSGDGGPAVAANIHQPRGFARAPDGAFLFADTFANRVRRVGTDGVITTFAGTGVAGFSGDGGPATEARLHYPHGLGTLPDGSLLIADELNYRVRKVGLDGTISTVAGTGAAGFGGDGGPATAATIGASRGLAATTDGGFLIADSSNHRIRAVSPSGVISTVAGTGVAGFSGDGGPATSAMLSLPFGVAPMPDGSFLVVDTNNDRIRRVVDGVITTVAGSGANGYGGDKGPAVDAMLNRPHNVAVLDSGSYFIADVANHRVRQVSPTGTITTVAGSGTSGFSADGTVATASALSSPKAMLAHLDGFLIADSGNARVRYVGPEPPPG